ncbi:LEAF RUST 10 DISEASE-RESISTANCE LOCUS RECEPTOR-LIKE PROTEIN KINASE-like protein 2.7 isoform X2 [Cinnamomum micranthum f. kanehirae]|uniref:LEAF RUST 10 DISEASE-RESISTANCE LOCUS RECEPTOR-LIKE PROTEIN KINASE-like protein 2.7 isoform X2 n=1 Tax=Cinnamomum micranthum f. kanehirae TaxID=337451 RepID=A0A3S3MEC9_9MAGN|nr:LEAF RUST 10 DISEASE-RESISTANCE LOCUS RECEPTOR-LIKE PROTEIN KINASE-like protein 2.7 isoform X2 [Cinnamomum micranthum f. kanehirae]
MTVFIRTTSISQGNSSEQNPICAPTKVNCGNISSITYPFSIEGRPENCSYPGFNLTCKNNSPEMEIGSKTYFVKAIDYDSQMLTIVDTDVIGKECSLRASSSTLDFSRFAYTPNDVNLTFYYNCSNPSRNSSLNQADSKPNRRILEMLWRMVSRVSWVAGAGNCRDCIVSGGNCGYDPGQPDLPVCHCGHKAYTGICPLQSAVSGVVSSLLVGFCLVAFIRKCMRTLGTGSKVEAFLQNYSSLAPQRFRYSELKKITNSFIDKLGEGSYGSVFKGKLKDGRLVAVKVLNNSKGNGEEFINEVASIGRTYHVNIVTLLGYCYERSKRALIYEFMSNGSLEKFIYSNKSGGTQRILDCEKLFQIAVGIARGLEYLHRGCSMRILHFDIKPHNILLDDEFCPKISDFGLAKLCPKQESIISMQDARGTIGYIAPEVYCRNIGGVSYKSDVYSYGMMVLEMVGGRKNIDARVENTSEIYFPHWVYNHMALENNVELIGIMDEEEKEIAKKMVLVGLWCIQTDPKIRPSMSRVLEMFEGSVQSLEMPPKPYLSSP